MFDQKHLLTLCGQKFVHAIFLALVLSFAAPLSQPVLAQDDTINKLIDGDNSNATQKPSDITDPSSQQQTGDQKPTDPLKSIIKQSDKTDAAIDPGKDPATTPGTLTDQGETVKAKASDKDKAQKEVWKAGKRPIDNFKLISAHPLPGEDCKKVIFESRPSLKKRHDTKAGTTVTFNVDNLCLIGLRNDSTNKSFVMRLGEAFDSLAIFADPQLFSGQVISPGQQIMIPIRPLPVGEINVSIDLMWESDLEDSNAKVDQLSMRLLRRK